MSNVTSPFQILEKTFQGTYMAFTKVPLQLRRSCPASYLSSSSSTSMDALKKSEENKGKKIAPEEQRISGENPIAEEIPQEIAVEVNEVRNLPLDKGDYRVIYLSPDSLSMSLGPVCHDLEWFRVSSMSAIFPKVEDEAHSYQVVDGKDPWARTLRNWPSKAQKDFLPWLNRVLLLKGEDLKMKGIFNILQYVRYPISPNKTFLSALTAFWSISTNTFHFRFGMMTPTLLDLAVLFGLKPNGKIIDPRVGEASKADKESFDFTDESYTGWIAKFSRSEGEVEEEEYIAFLLYWISRYLVCSPQFKIDKSQFPLAMALALADASPSRNIALGPYVLGTLYYSLFKLIDSGFTSWGGPLWMLQIWGYAYFADIRPKLAQFSEDVIPLNSYGLKFLYTDEVFKSLAEYLSSFYHFKLLPTEQAAILSLMDVKPVGDSWLRSAINNFRHPITKLFWNRCLTPRDLHHSVSVGRVGKSRCGVETYNPHYVALQFGLGQNLPLPMLSLWNWPLSKRKPIKNLDEIKKINSFISFFARNYYNSELCYFPRTFIRTSTVDSNFLIFWEQYVSNRASLSSIFAHYGIDNELTDSTSVNMQETPIARGKNFINELRSIYAFENFHGVKYNPKWSKIELLFLRRGWSDDMWADYKRWNKGKLYSAFEAWYDEFAPPLPTAKFGIAASMTSRPVSRDNDVTFTGIYATERQIKSMPRQVRVVG